MLTRLRIRLLDRPGSLGRVTALLGRAGVDIHQVAVLERADGRAVNDLVVCMPAAMLPGAVARALGEVPGVRVEGCWQTGGSLDVGTDIEVLGEVVANPSRAVETFVDAAPRLLHAHWAAVLDTAADRLVYASWRAPRLTPPPRLTPLRTRGMTAGDGSRLAVAPLGENLAVLVGRRNAPPFHPTELDRLATMAGTVDAVLAATGLRETATTVRPHSLALISQKTVRQEPGEAKAPLVEQKRRARS